VGPQAGFIAIDEIIEFVGNLLDSLPGLRAHERRIAQGTGYRCLRNAGPICDVT